MNKLMKDVEDFHVATDSHVSPYPTAIRIENPDLVDLRMDLIQEETKEVISAGSLPQIAKELCDLIYVSIGTALAYGINLQPIWNEVHTSNMSKTENVQKREDGKILKSMNYKKANIRPLILDQMDTGIRKELQQSDVK